MIVRDLIYDTIWIPGRNYDEQIKPKVSILLPTFSRGRSGLFRKCMETLLSQSLADLEIIIIDDASTDGTADQITEFMERDGRVSCLRHPKNIGLPAVSEFEGFLKARADLIGFAFDDNLFKKDAYQRLVKESEKTPWAMIYGYIEFAYKDFRSGQVSVTRLGFKKPQGDLRTSNFIPNCAVLLPRSIIEDVGLFDPHVVIARVCDWDLWSRVCERYEVRFVDIEIALEQGVVEADSLGNTYVLDSWAASEWINTSRNRQLHPENFPDYDVLSAKPGHGNSTRIAIENMARNFAAKRGWPLPQPQAIPVDNDVGYILVVVVHYDASTTLCFDMLPPSIALKVRIVTLFGGFDIEELARASCVIFVRQIGIFKSWIDVAKLFAIPIYYYLDDNLLLLNENGEVESRDFVGVKFREHMRSFAGVLVPSKPLAEYFSNNLLHDNVLYFPVACANQTPLSVDHKIPSNPDEIVIASIIGNHRQKGLWEIAMPALEKLVQQGTKIHLIAPKPSAEDYKGAADNPIDGLRITTLEFDVSYLFALRQFARFSPDFMIHPPSRTANNKFKTLNPLLSAHLTGAVPIVPLTPPYEDIGDCENAILVPSPFESISWFKALKCATEGSVNLTEMRSKNASFCKQMFAGNENDKVLRSLLSQAGGEVSLFEQNRRLHRLPWFLRGKGAAELQELEQIRNSTYWRIGAGLRSTMGKSRHLRQAIRAMTRNFVK